MGDSKIGIRAGSRLDCFLDCPRLAFIRTELDADVFAITAFAGNGFSVGFFEIVWVGEQDRALTIMFVADKSAHADRFEKRMVELGCRPIRCTVGAGGDQAAMCLGFIANIHHDTTIGQFDSHCFIRVDPIVRTRHGNFPCVPSLSIVVAVNRSGDARAVSVATGPGR